MSSCILLIFHLTILFQPAFQDIYKLHDSIIPKHYDLKLLSSVEDEITYTGTLGIVTQCLNATNKISLHRDWSIKFDKIELKEIDSPQHRTTVADVPMENILYSKKLGFLMISTKENLKENHYYLISFEFRGNLTDTPSGIFRGNFSTSSGASFYAVSFFEPIGARKAFPCFDEPGMTTTFNLSIGRKEKYNATSNMPLDKSEAVEGKEGWYWDHFKSSISMSTYSLCFVIYDAGFAWIGKEGEQIRILARKDIKSTLSMVTKTSPKLIAYFQKYFQVPFPFPKLDLIAIPQVIGKEDSVTSPGIVIIQEKLLSYEPFVMKQDDVQDLLYYISQKIAFQWISVIAVNWWSDLWIKRGLANQNTRLALGDLSENQCIERDVPDALLKYFHHAGGLSFSDEVYGDPDSVTAELSSTDYEKCAILMRMAQHLTGDKAIEDITTPFLKKENFQKVDQGDFWKMFEDSSPKYSRIGEVPLSEVMKSWLTNGGLPVVEVTRNYSLRTATFTQKVLHADLDKRMPCWWIPVTYAFKSESKTLNTNVRDWLRCPSRPVKIESLPSSDWLLLNLNVTSAYRVKYDIENWKLLHSTLKEPLLYKTIPPLNRMQLVDDLCEFTIRGNLNLTVGFLLEFLDFLRFDESYGTWAAFSQNMYNLHWRLQSDKEAVDLLDTYMQNLLRRHFKNRKFDLKENSLLNVSFSTVITEASCFFKLPSCLKEVRNSFKKYQESKSPFYVNPPFSTDLRDVIFCYAIKHGGINEFNFILSALTKTTNIFESEDMLRGLYCTQDPSLLKQIPTSRRVPREIKPFRYQRKENNITRNNLRNLFKREVPENKNDSTELLQSSSNGTRSKTIANTNDSINPQGSNDTKASNATNLPGDTVNPPGNSSSTDKPSSNDTKPGPLDGNSTKPGSPEPTPTKIKMVSDGPDLKFIISHSRMDIASDLFYKNILKMALPKALHCIWLYTERINQEKELENFKQFFEMHKDVFSCIDHQIKERIKGIEHNLRWQDRKIEEVIRALRKGAKEEMRSDAYMYIVDCTWRLCIILGFLSMFFL